MSDTKLKPCPFCNARAEIEKEKLPGWPVVYKIKCDHSYFCYLWANSGREFDTRVELKQAWNWRGDDGV